MKLLVTSLSILLATSAVAAEAPQAASPAPAENGASAPAPSAERVVLARRFVALTISGEELSDSIRAGFMQGAASSLDAIEDEKERSAVEDQVQLFATRLEPKIRESLPGVLEAYAQVYAREFSAQELRAMIDFGESPAGKHYLSRMGAIDGEPEVLEAYDKLQANLMPVLDEASKERCAKQAAERLAAGDTNAKCRLSAESEARSS